MDQVVSAAYCRTSMFDSDDHLKTVLDSMHPSWREGVLKYRRSEDIRAAISGRAMLKYLLQKSGLNSQQEMKFGVRGKPYFPHLPHVDFSISHSHEYAICAAGVNARVGVDIEYIRQIDFSDFHKMMSPEQWEQIYKNNDPVKEFFRLWTLKEAVVKADGRGMLIDFCNIPDSEFIQLQDEHKLRNIALNLLRGYQVQLAISAETTASPEIYTPGYSDILEPS